MTCCILVTIARLEQHLTFIRKDFGDQAIKLMTLQIGIIHHDTFFCLGAKQFIYFRSSLLFVSRCAYFRYVSCP